MASIQDPLLAMLAQRLADVRQIRSEELVAGGAAQILAGRSVAENYAAQVAYIRAFTDVIEICADVDRERYATNKTKEQESSTRD